MRTIRAFLCALVRGHTYDVRRNVYFWFGFAWGLPIPVFSVGLELAFLGLNGRSLLEIYSGNPMHFFFLVHPAVFGVVFGALGTVRRDLEMENGLLLRRLTEQAITDPLTGLYNRRYAAEEFANILHRARRAGRGAVVVAIDLDGFKKVNDALGHAEGDRVLREFAAAFRAALRKGDLLARMGGDEFLLVVEGEAEGVGAAVDRVRREFRARTGGGFSVGMARFPEDGGAPDILLTQADLRLMRSKRSLRGVPVP